MEDDSQIDPLDQPYFSAHESLPPQWEPEHVGKRLVKAFVTLDQLPLPRGPREPGGHWPRHAVEWADLLAQAELDEAERRERYEARNRELLRPTGLEIAQMETVLDWLRELRAEDSGMALVTGLWAMRTARRRSVKALCKEKKWAPHTFYRKRAKALSYLADRLNSRGAPVF